jgi:lysylphosphatidylglycerol synthetase-like protein (DUF2156 family)
MAPLSRDRAHPYIPGMLTRFISSFAFGAFALWTLLCLGLWGVISLGGDLLRWIAGSMGGDGFVRSALGFLEAFGTFLLAWVWVAGAALIAVAGMILRKAARNATTIRMESVHFRTGEDWAPREMKDVTPPGPPETDPQTKRLPPRAES